MTEVVALLRGINVGGRHRLSMAQVREALDGAGLGPTRTHIQSGNVVLHAPLDGGALPPGLQARVAGLLGELAGFDVPTLLLTGDELREILRDNPFSPEEGRLEHVVVLPEPAAPGLVATLRQLAEADDSGDRLAVLGRAVYLDHPRGLSNSVLASRATARLRQGTARNLTTLRALAAMLA